MTEEKKTQKPANHSKNDSKKGGKNAAILDRKFQRLNKFYL